MQIFGSRLRHDERLLARNEEPTLGSHLITPRPGFAHHGIYVGDGKVVYYGDALGKHLLGGTVQEVCLASFTRGRPAWVRRHELVRFDCAEVIRRARSRLGEDSYSVLSSNCEHFCEWCLHGKHRSYQVESLMALPPSWTERSARCLPGCSRRRHYASGLKAIGFDVSERTACFISASGWLDAC